VTISKLPSVEFALGLACSIVLYALDKSGKNNGAITLVLTAVAGALFLHATLTVPWLWDSANTALKVWRVAMATSVVVLAISRFCIWAWPESTQKTQDVAASLDEIKAILRGITNPDYRDVVANIVHAFEPNARITVGGSLLGPDRQRKIDIQVQSSDSKDPRLTAIDVFDLPEGSKVGIEIVDSADSRKSDLGADAMLICSNTGFTSDAIKKAKRKRIGLISVLRRGDKRVKAVISEEVYLRKVAVSETQFTYTAADGENANLLRSSGAKRMISRIIENRSTCGCNSESRRSSWPTRN